jgi:hypothetical protein
MDSPSRDLAQEEILEGIIHDVPDVEPAESPSSYLNSFGDEVDRRENEADGSNDGEGDSSNDREAGRHLTKSSEVYI